MLICTTANSETIDTGNILTNSTFGTGETTSTTGWSTDGDHGIHTHGEWGFPYQTGMDDSGGVLAFEGHTEDNVYQDVDLVDDGHLTQQQMNQGFTSTMSADVWFWNNIENTFTLKQTITGSDGSVTTQVRDINDHDPNRVGNGGQFTNYTNVYIQGSNTQTDITIRSEVYNETAGTSYDDYHRGPDVDNIKLNITYKDVPPINEDAQEAIDDIVDNLPDLPEDIFEEESFFEEVIFQEESFFEEFEEMFVVTEDVAMMNELPDMDEMEEMEMEEEIEMEEEMEMEEEVLEDKEVSNDNNDMETAEKDSDSMEEKQESEEGTSEVAENEDEESKPDSEDTEDTEVQTEDSKKQEIVQQKEVQDKKSINVEVAEVEVTSVKEVTLFSNQDSLDTYTDIAFYQADNIYVSVDTDFFQQADLSQYNQQIYENVSLSSYINNDPIEIQKKKLEQIRRNKQKILLELQALRN
jgi:hypothetical protein